MAAHAAVCTGVLGPEQPPEDLVRPAAELAGAARPGTVVVDGATRRLVELQFTWAQQPGGTGLGGGEVTAPVAASGKVRGIPGVHADLVGRDDELASAVRVVEAARAGTGGVLFICGEVGVGKSRLLGELHRHAGGSVLWLQGQCLSYGHGLAHWPIRELLCHWLGTSTQAPEMRLRARLRNHLEQLFQGGDVAEVSAGLAALLGLDPHGASDRRSPEARERLAATALRTLLARLAEHRPVVVAVEDVHWADTSSLALLEQLFELTEQVGAVIALTHRPEREHPSWQLRELALRRHAHRSTEVTVDPLPAGADAELLAALVGTVPLPAGLRNQLLAAAEGNPFFLEELVRSVRGAGTRAGLEIPATVEQVVGGRIARLPTAAQQLLAAAAVLGRTFALDLLTAVLELDRAPTGTVGLLARHGLLVQTRGWPSVEYQFRHAVIHEAAYRSVWPPRRRDLHRRAAVQLQDGAGSAPDHGALARHWQQAGDDDRALSCHRRAARAAFGVHALDVAAHHFAEGLAAAGRLDATDRACDLSLGLGQVWRLSGEGDPERHLVRALDGAVATGDGDTGWRARYELGCWLGFAWDRRGEALAHFETAARDAGLLGDVPGQVESLCVWALLLANELDLTAAIRQAERAIQLVGDLGDEVAVGGALDVRKLCAVFLGELDLFEDLLPRLTDVLHRHDQLWTLQFVLAEAALVAVATGRWDDAAARQAQAFEVNRRCGDRISAPYLVSTAGRIERGHGACGTALDLGRDAVASAAGHGGWWEPWARTELGITLLEVGQREAAIEQLEHGAAAGLTSQAVRARAHLAMARWRAGDRDRAVTDLREAERLLGRATLPAGRAYLFGADATLACAAVRLARGETAAAERLVAPVLAAAETSGWAEPLALALLLLARCRAARCDVEHAREPARRALDVGVRTGLPAVAVAARAVLAGLDEPDGPGLLARARADAVELSGSLNDAQDRRCFVESALAEIDELAGIIPPTTRR